VKIEDWKRSMNTIESLKKKKVVGEKLTCLTAYDASFAQILDEAGVDIILVGDSLGMVIQGKETTLPVTVDEMVYHASAVKLGAPEAFIVVDMPFMSYKSPDDALINAGDLMKKSGANMVKLEGGKNQLDTVKKLSNFGIPVCAHLGLLPQSVHKTSGYRVQGKEENDANVLFDEALSLQNSGADMLVLECVPANLAKRISESLDIPVIGIGAGADCDGQVLVLYDILAISKGKRPKFSKDFLAGQDSILDALKSYVNAVKTSEFPAAEHSF